jgi:hypothetical protein
MKFYEVTCLTGMGVLKYKPKVSVLFRCMFVGSEFSKERIKEEIRVSYVYQYSAFLSACTHRLICFENSNKQ